MAVKVLFLTIVGLILVVVTSGLLPEVGRANLIEQADARTPEAEEAVVNEFEQKLLNMFGLSRRPKPNRSKPIPRIMQHLYKAHMGEDSDGPHSLDEGWEPGFDLPHEAIASKVNTARSFYHLESEERPDGLPDNHIRLVFNVSSLPSHEDLHFSELLLHRRAIEQHMDLDASDRLHRINLYEVIKMVDEANDDQEAVDDFDITKEQKRLVRMVNRRRKKFGRKHKKNSHITRLLDTRVVDTTNTTWERFDVTASTMRWLKEPNHGLVVEVIQEHSGEAPKNGGEKHVRLRRGVADVTNPDNWYHERPLILAYTNDGQPTNLSRRSRRKRKANRRRGKGKRKNCVRKSLYVDFKAVSWDDWIVAPHGYHAFFCSGECPFPLADYMNATNHAIVQTLVNAVEPALAPMPCCVPTELSPISMLYLDELELVVLRTYQQMSVDACGCR